MLSPVLVLWLHLLSPQTVMAGAAVAGMSWGVSGAETAAAATDASARCSGLETSDPLQVGDGAVCLALHLSVEAVN